MVNERSAPLSPEEAGKEVEGIVAAANRLGVELDAPEAVQWIIAMSAAEREQAFAQDAQTGVFGHRISLLDFDQAELDYFRRLAEKVRVVQHPQVESAIAIAGSSAQGKVQLFPGDNDFFERVNIKAASENEAREILRKVLRETALRAFSEPDIVLVEVNFGVFPKPLLERGIQRAAGDSITWTPQDVLQGFITVQGADGQPFTIHWGEAQAGLGWSYLGWIVADRAAGRIALASNMLDVTWEAPDGQLLSLDGMIDPFFQEIYLEHKAIPLFTKIIKHVDQSAMNAYINAMRWQAFHYTHEEPNYGKAAKRLYNLFRLTDRLEAAAYVRELFDEPGAQLYQVPGLLEAADLAREERAGIDRETIVHQVDHVIRAIGDAVEGEAGAKLTRELVRLRHHIAGQLAEDVPWEELLQEARKQCLGLVNEYFRVRLFGLPEIASFVAELKDKSQV